MLEIAIRVEARKGFVLCKVFTPFVLSQMDAIVGGQAVRKQVPKNERKGVSIDPKQATHGEAHDGSSAMALGQQVMKGGQLNSNGPRNAGLSGKPSVLAREQIHNKHCFPLSISFYPLLGFLSWCPV